MYFRFCLIGGTGVSWESKLIIMYSEKAIIASKTQVRVSNRVISLSEKGRVMDFF